MKSIALSLALVACLALLGAGAWFFLAGGSGGGGGGGAQPRPAAAAQPRAPQPGFQVDLRSVGSAGQQAQSGVTTSVAWPVEVELELVGAADGLAGEGLPPLGSGRSARLRGQVSLDDRRGTPATLTVIAGLNAGRVIETNPDGYFGVPDLYPGIALVEVRGPAIRGSLRELRLLRGQETRLHLSYGAPGSVAGRVYDEANEGLAGVAVELDGQAAVTDEKGIFRFAGIPGGSDAVLILRAAGYATQYHRVGVLAARDVPVGHYEYRMERGGSLEVELPRQAGVAGPAQLLLSTGMSEVQSHFAWHLLGPYEIVPGASLRIDDLPPMRIQVRVQHRGARCVPATATALVRPDHVERLSFELEAAPTLSGRVTDPAGLAAPNALVRMEAPDRAAATLAALRLMPGDFELQFYPSLAAAAQEARSDHDGNFAFTRWPELAPAVYLVATSADGRLRAGRAVRADEERADLRLAPVEEGRGQVQIDFGARTQGLPVQVSVNGELRPEVLLAVGRELEIDGLAAGRWRLRARWNGELLIGGAGFEEFELRGLERRSLSLPEGAIQGQDPDTLERARGL